MKKAVLTFAALATMVTGISSFSAPASAGEQGMVIQVQSQQGWGDDNYQPIRPLDRDRRGQNQYPGQNPGQYNDRDQPQQGWDRRNDNRPGWGEPQRWRPEAVSPRRVAIMLERRGYDVRDVRFERSTYFVRAIRPNGRRVMVLVDGRSGRIVGERPMGGPRY